MEKEETKMEEKEKKRKIVVKSSTTIQSQTENLPQEMATVFRLVDFTIYDGGGEPEEEKEGLSDEDEKEEKKKEVKKKEQKKYEKQCLIQLFGLDEKGKTYSLLVENFKPFFYVEVTDAWSQTPSMKNEFINHIKKIIGPYWADSILKSELVKKKKLYGFDRGKKYQFIVITFQNIATFNKVKNLWYYNYDPKIGGSKLRPNGYPFAGTNITLYESNIPPLLRFFHLMDISPSGWISVTSCTFKKGIYQKNTTCDYELVVSDFKRNIQPLNDKETIVPFKICSFDIEASSSHGDFPVPVKTYKKLATNILEKLLPDPKKQNWNNNFETKEEMWQFIHHLILYAFGYSKDSTYEIDLVYPKNKISQKSVEQQIQLIQNKPYSPQVYKKSEKKESETIESLFEKLHENIENDAPEDIPLFEKETNSNCHKGKEKEGTITGTIVDILYDLTVAREEKLKLLTTIFNDVFPPLEGDKVTFIGSTFIRYGEKNPYLNHGVVLNSCSPIPSLQHTQIETYSTEKEVLIAWQKMIQRENPDIIIGYNIFGFDYEFLFRRAIETECEEEFLKLSRNRDEVCASQELDSFRKPTGKWKIEESSIQIASGTHELKFIKMNGRLQIDLYNFFRREENLTSYKLDYVAGYFIGDYIKTVKREENMNRTVIKTANMTGLFAGSYIHFEEIGHSVDYYEGGKKFQVLGVNEDEKTFWIQEPVQFTKKTKWGLAKDDVTPKDIFEMTNGTADDRAVIMKYCFQDCNLVHNLLNKRDVLTGFIEMAKICSVPINFLVMRGQGIKLTSFIAKKCREKEVLMPVMEKGAADEGYEGAIVLDPKCNLYLDNPVACVDYASLYPSSMISENLSHDTKVWTKEYDLLGNMIRETGVKDPMTGQFIYDNLPGLEYVDITYDTYSYVRKTTPSSAAEKVLSGKKICRFEQTIKGIMPSILEELLQARKKTRKLIPQQTDEFMKNVLDKRQLGYKVTANSLYGQCGAKTSTFYEKDIAASTTSTGRLLLIYAKRVIEECYGDSICDTTKFGPVCTKAEYIYGDSVANYTPVYIRAKQSNKFHIIDIVTIEELANKYGNGKWRMCVEPGKQEKEICELDGIDTWTEKGWTPIHRVIRHRLAENKKMIRILTHTGLVDVTDDHSLLLTSGEEISPKECKIGDKLMHKEVPLIENNSTYFNIDEDENGNKYISCEGKTQKYLAKQFNYLYHNGYSNINISQNERMYLKYEKGKQRESPNAIKKMDEIEYEGYVYDLTTENHHFSAGVGQMVVHNTDSVFFTFNLQDPKTGQPIRGKDALEITIELAQQAGHLASKFLKAPHDLEYEKTFMPFCLLSKKRYVGMLYETNVNECKRKEMGIVLKRRDNAPIVKDVYGGIIDILMKKQDIKEAIEFLQSSLETLVSGNCPMDKLVITKSLRSGYKNPKSIAHKVLADRMTERDPGNKPSSGDRIPFVYIENTDPKALQGDKIETPNFILQNNMKIDYGFYITNQIMKPVQQVFALVLEDIYKLMNQKGMGIKFGQKVKILKKQWKDNPVKFLDKLEDLKNKEVLTLLFNKYLREIENSKKGCISLNKYFLSMKKK
jgi:DNA polymerase elongation subunit (family B)